MKLILGGARSGKSRYAQQLLMQYPEVTFVATALAFDDGMKERIRRHRLDRPATWYTVEKYKQFTEPFLTQAVLVDCITLLVSNLMMEAHADYDQVGADAFNALEKSILQELDQLIACAQGRELILVSNEVGLGLASPYALGNAFRDISGRVNQYLAAQADEVIFMVSGLPLVVKHASH